MRIGPPRTPCERSAALACLFQHDARVSDRVANATALADLGEIELSGLVAAWSGDEAVAAGLLHIAADGSAFVWPPELSVAIRTSDGIAVEVLNELADRAEKAGCTFLQAAVAPERNDQRRALESAGFDEIAELIYLQHPLGRDLPERETLSGRWIAFSDADEARFAATAERTYVASQDCPAFAGVRTAADSLRSYRSAGSFTPERWQIIEQSGCDVGIILVNDHPEDRSREIIYVGVTPEARGRGIGRTMISAVLHEAVFDSCEAVLAAADSNNRPALEIYDRLGFFPCGRQVVSIRRWKR